jgi:hypothetical protein
MAHIGEASAVSDLDLGGEVWRASKLLVSWRRVCETCEPP